MVSNAISFLKGPIEGAGVIILILKDQGNFSSLAESKKERPLDSSLSKMLLFACIVPTAHVICSSF